MLRNVLTGTMRHLHWLLLAFMLVNLGCEQHPLAQDRPAPSQLPAQTFTAEDERAAWILALRKMAEGKSKENYDWRPIVGAALGGVFTLIGVFLTMRSTEARERDRLNAEATRNHEQMNHQGGLEKAKIDAQSKVESERLSHQAELERLKLEADATLARDTSTTEARLGYTDKLLDLRLRQLEQFIAPLRALLKQSQGVTQKLQLQLAKNTSLYNWEDPVKKRGLRIVINGISHDFRLLDRLPALKNDPEAGPLIAEIIRIGKQITKLISKNAGLALSELSEDADKTPAAAFGNHAASESASTSRNDAAAVTESPSNLPDTLGKYLAHFAILQRINADKGTTPYDPGTHEIGYYPRELNNLVEKEYRQLLGDLRPYFETSAAVLAELKRRAEAANVLSKQ